jgi:hypothetical protein
MKIVTMTYQRMLTGNPKKLRKTKVKGLMKICNVKCVNNNMKQKTNYFNILKKKDMLHSNDNNRYKIDLKIYIYR